MSMGKLVFNQIYYKIVNFQIYLTLQSPNMISVIDAVLWLQITIYIFARIVVTSISI